MGIKTKINHLFLSVLVITTVSFAVILSSSNSSADESVKLSDVAIAVPSSCEISGVGTNSHSANVNNGTYEENIGKTTLTVFCNDGGGYAIYAVGYTGEEIGGTNSTKLVGEDLGLTIDTGLYTQGTTVNSVWSMKVSKVNDSSVSYNPNNLTIENGFNNYHVVPATYTKVATFTSTTDLTLGSKLETTYSAYVSGTQRADTYNGKVKYTLVHPASGVPNTEQACNASTICYFPNANGLVTDTMGDQTANYSDNTNTITSNMDVNLWPSNFKRSGYGFVGWSDKYDWALNENDANGNGTGVNLGYHIYGPMANINVGDVSAKGLSLYAVWAPSAGYLQGYTCPDNTTMPIGKVTALTDARDNDTYAVAKLADGKCWMIENLRLDYDAAHNTDGSLAQGYGGVFAGLAEPETTYDGFNNVTIANSLYYSGIQSDTASIDINANDSSSLRFPRYTNENTVSSALNMSSPDTNVYLYGNYYSWAAAIANTNHYDSPTATDDNGKTSETANTSICPYGWHIPTGTGSGEFGQLSNSLGGYKDENNIAQTMNSNTTPSGVTMINIMKGYPNNYLYSGSQSSSGPGYRGSRGVYWTSTASGQDTVYHFQILGRLYVQPGTSSVTNQKYYGRPIRCLANY